MSMSLSSTWELLVARQSSLPPQTQEFGRNPGIQRLHSVKHRSPYSAHTWQGNDETESEKNNNNQKLPLINKVTKPELI